MGTEGAKPLNLNPKLSPLTFTTLQLTIETSCGTGVSTIDNK